MTYRTEIVFCFWRRSSKRKSFGPAQVYFLLTKQNSGKHLFWILYASVVCSNIHINKMSNVSQYTSCPNKMKIEPNRTFTTTTLTVSQIATVPKTIQS